MLPILPGFLSRAGTARGSAIKRSTPLYHTQQRGQPAPEWHQRRIQLAPEAPVYRQAGRAEIARKVWTQPDKTDGQTQAKTGGTGRQSQTDRDETDRVQTEQLFDGSATHGI